MSRSFLQNFSEKIALYKKLNLQRDIEASVRISPTSFAIGGEIYTSFSSNDYLSLASNVEVVNASHEASVEYGFGASASRLISGNHPLYNELETKLANHYKTESALIFSSGYTANVGCISSIANKNDLVIADKFVHACIIDGVKLSGAKLIRFEHNNTLHCAEIIQNYRKNYKNCFLAIESIYSMIGDIAPIHEFDALCQQNDMVMFIDNAHGFGVLTLPNISEPKIISGSLSKGLGSIGGYICANKIVIDYLINTSRNFIFTTALPPAAIAAASKAYDMHKKQSKKLLQNIQLFSNLMNSLSSSSHIIPVYAKDSKSALKQSKSLRELKILVKAIRQPTVPKPLLRVSLCAEHSTNQIEELCHAVKNLPTEFIET